MKQKHCHYCGRFFIPDRRLGDRQKSCGRLECKKRRKKESQASWTRKNPDYFKKQYAKTKFWLAQNRGYLRRRRQKQRDIQDEYPHVSPIKTIRLLVPVKLLKNDIQDECLVLSPIDTSTYIARSGW